MSRRPPPRRRSKANVEAEIIVKKRGEIVHKDMEQIIRDSPVEPGPAGVTVTHGKKYWNSTRADGLTVESTCSVSLRCEQDQEALYNANEWASELAYKFMDHNARRVEADVDKFLDTDPRSQCSK